MLASDLTGNQRHFPRARHFNDIHGIFTRAGALQGVHGARQETLSDEAVEAAHNDGEPQSLG
jgi:hypothetical protein